MQVVDMGTPRLPSESSARVTVRVTDVNDCPPRFAAAAHDVTLLLPTARGVAVLALPAGDPDLPPGGALKYDIIEVRHIILFTTRACVWKASSWPPTGCS